MTSNAEQCRQWRLNNPDYQKQWRAKNKAKLREYEKTNHYRHRMRSYGLWKGEWDAILECQSFTCPLCGTQEPGGRGWCCDHDHTCCPAGESGCGTCVRGAVCFACNRRRIPVMEWLHERGDFSHPYLLNNWIHKRLEWRARFIHSEAQNPGQ